MRLGFLHVVTAVILLLPIYGQESTSKRQSDQNTTKTQQEQHPNPAPSKSSVQIANIDKPTTEGQKHGHADDPESYLNALIAPNNISNLALAFVGIVGAFVALRSLSWLKKQTKAMQSQVDLMRSQARMIERQVELTEPQLHVESVSAIQLEEGQSPTFFVRIRNSGIIAARNVAISITAEMDTRRKVSSNRDQIMDIPAHESVDCFLPTSVVLDKNLWLAYTSGTQPLRISGQVKWADKTEEYCYRYYPWRSANRPEGIPVFVLCGFETGITTALEIQAAMLPMKGGVPTIKIEPSRTDPPQNAGDSNNED